MKNVKENMGITGNSPVTQAFLLKLSSTGVCFPSWRAERENRDSAPPHRQKKEGSFPASK